MDPTHGEYQFYLIICLWRIMCKLKSNWKMFRSSLHPYHLPPIFHINNHKNHQNHLKTLSLEQFIRYIYQYIFIYTISNYNSSFYTDLITFLMSFKIFSKFIFFISCKWMFLKVVFCFVKNISLHFRRTLVVSTKKSMHYFLDLCNSRTVSTLQMIKFKWAANFDWVTTQDRVSETQYILIFGKSPVDVSH